ncbi:MAG: 4-hydroxythreonine-4-phosphate dehydrogenase PdxA [Bacteroidota bacterium]
MGDPAGVGPEIALKTFAKLKESSLPFIPVLIGSFEVLKLYNPDKLDTYTITDPENLHTQLNNTDSHVICDVPFSGELPVPGRGNENTGRESLRYVDIALDLWKRGIINCMVTGPVSKSLIERSGVPFTGHTEYIANYIGEDNPSMLMFSPKYRVLLVTTHIPVSRVKDEVTSAKIQHVIETGYHAISKIEGRPARMAICGLDPHCGDGGAIGEFDTTVTVTMVEKLKQMGMHISGPYAADTLFMPAKWEQYDCVVAMYHDQGLIPFKVLAFEDGVNVTLGLSIVRTSVDHGTAFDIAGKNLAGYSSMVKAVHLAYLLLTGK